MKVLGLDETLQNLRKYIVDEAIENEALKKAGKVTQEAVIEEAPIDNRNPPDHASLHKNIKVSRPRDGEVKVHTGGAYHAHLVEDGRSGGSAVVIKNGKRQRVTWGPTSPNPFFSRGFGKSNIPARQAMVDELKKGLDL